MRRKGFTLIEVMVVLSILAIIAILSYNFFGSSMRDASLSREAILVHKNLQTISDAFHNYILENGSAPATGVYTTDDTIESTLGIDLDLPSIADGHTVAPRHMGIAIRGYDFNSDAVLDTYAYLKYATEDLCKKYNELFCPACGDYLASTVDYTNEPRAWSGGCFVSSGMYWIDAVVELEK